MERALVYISSDKRVMMHHLLRKMGREIVRRQSVHEPGKRQFLIDAQEIYDVLADETVSPFIYVFFFFFLYIILFIWLSGYVQAGQNCYD